MSWTTLLLSVLASSAGEVEDLTAKLRDLDTKVLATDAAKAEELSLMLGKDVRERIAAANRRDLEAWRAISTREQWEQFRDVRIKALRESLGRYPAPAVPTVHVALRLSSGEHRIENIVFESRPGLWVTANLYLPAKPADSMPGILICHSHHNPKTEGELQDMGVHWARQGCAVLVMDQLGHGERRVHPFTSAGSYAKPFRAGRQDYFFRYNVGMQLSLLGDSLAGWMAWDLMRGVDVLLNHAKADKDRIALLGAVAGGGDPAAVAAALDPRIAVVVPFNFGGPQPETTFPLPADAEQRFNYAGGGSWESTRNLRLSARDDFLPWVIVGSVAPRGLVYAHEFAWDHERDPVWKRFEKIWELYGKRDRLAETHGRGSVRGQGPGNTHCNNIGAEHRKGIHPAFEKWLRIPVPEKEARERRPSTELLCLTSEIMEKVKTKPALAVAAAVADERLAEARRRLAALTPDKRRERLIADWDILFGGAKLGGQKWLALADVDRRAGIPVEHLLLMVERDIKVPVLLLTPPNPKGQPPVVVGLCQEGMQRFLKENATAISRLLRGGAAICLPDVRGTGKTRPGDGRGRSSTATAHSASEQMLGKTLVGARLRDVLAVLDYLKSRDDLDGKRVLLWGDSFAPVNPLERDLVVPHDVADAPAIAEPVGGLLALFGALYHDRVRAVAIRGGLASYRSLLDNPFVYVPHDAVVPGAMTAGDLADVLAVLGPRPIRLEGLVDGQNRQLTKEALKKEFGVSDKRVIEATQASDEQLATWMLENLK